MLLDGIHPSGAKGVRGSHQLPQPGLRLELWGQGAELDEDTKVKLWKAPSKGGCFTTVERQTMKSNEWNAIKLGE